MIVGETSVVEDRDALILASHTPDIRAPKPRQATAIAVDIAIAIAVGIVALGLLMWRAGWSNIDHNFPIEYQGDALFFGNAVFNGQLGDIFTGRSLGAPLGQQMGLSSYGVEWVQMWIAGHLGSAIDGPWLAISRFFQLTYVLAGMTAYWALRWISIRRLAAVLGALAFALLPTHESQISSIDLANIAVLPLVLAIAFRLASGASLTNLVPDSWGVPDRWRRRCGLGLIIACTLLAITGGNYFMLFNLFILASTAIAMLIRRKWWSRARLLGVATICAVVPLVVAYSPVILGRLFAGLGVTEDATVDRRAFAAYANGGDPFTLLLPFRGGPILNTLERIPSVGKFFHEFDSASITSELYVAYFGGTVVVSALVLLGLQLIGAYRPQDLFRRMTPIPPILKAVVLVGALTVLWYSRGALGTFLGFILPQVRGYAREATLVSLCAIAVLGIVASAFRYFPRNARGIAIGFLCLGLVESVVANGPLTQDDPNAVGMSSPVTRREVDLPLTGFGISVVTPGARGTKNLIEAANNSLAAGCTVLVLPLVKYPSDFGVGVVSYRAYDTLKPGLIHSAVKWTSGGLTGTPNNAFSDSWLGSYRKGDYAGLLTAADNAGYCGAVFFDSLHEAFFRAGILNGSEYIKPGTDVQAALSKHYGKPCYQEPEAAVQLYCRKT